ncbi:RidA family protein [Aquimarina gracilis]|uniref:RidA family protein n=1 Tax=Aquimarina gracilis TaxID=874422 RepID=A0ABU5ZT79_9FLAO|nr:RidA family protein [Aquimarina gracilis]MEB3345234.1 RidA family protein [Aquimarina gracilis]
MKNIVLVFNLFLLLFTSNSCKNEIEPKQKEEKEPEKISIVKEKWHWDNPEKQSESAGYAQVVKVGNTIYISGVPTDDLSPEGITRLYNTLKECLASFGATSKDVVKETLYTTDIEAMKKYNDARKAFYQGDYPAASWVQISRLYEPNAKLEVDLIAEITDSK